ncbi:hypothetical protein [Chitinophaga hostae]|uniref:Uncharacterized protein n=1 Tax=Chitinophaga hostae TaxID=2831022 RepID=A0ABS5J731_9BACT|nr:hypothetical protein [Chitinophaga hostae]MBS0031027.1 hypothetical protein [Chitinophaga hostae]
MSACLLASILALVQPQKGYGYGYANREDLSAYHYITMRTDSVSPAPKPADKPVEKVIDVSLPQIKEVPKSRRVVKPIAIPSPLPVKPIRIIKPKITVRKLI